MGGRIDMESRPGNGSKFWFTLNLDKQISVANVPANPETSSPVPANDGPPKAEGVAGNHATDVDSRRSIRVMLVGDNAINQKKDGSLTNSS